jgi:transglutaminase-like putative cysteine protease
MWNRLKSYERPQRWWDFPASLLLLAALMTAALRLDATNWTDHLSLIQTLTLAGLLAGLALGQSVLSRRLVLFLAGAYGLFLVAWVLGSTLGAEILWMERLSSLLGRLGRTTGDLVRQQPVNDPILFLFLMSALFWSLSVHAGFMATRHAHAWASTLPMGLALFIIHIYDPFWPFRTWYLAAYIFFSLLLLARLTFLRKYARWRRTNTRLPPYLGLDLIRTTLMATAVLVVLAWTAPALASSLPLAERAWARVSQPWTVARTRMSNAFASLRASVGLVNEYYGESLPLGRGNVLNDAIILAVDAPVRPEAGVRYYWRARVYDSYDAGWDSTLDEKRSVTPQRFDLSFPELQGRWEATFSFTPQVPIATLYTVPQPQWVSRPVEVDLAANPDETVDLGSLHAVNFLRPGETYQVRSSVTAVTIADLRAATGEVPEWVASRYLQLPDTITGRTRELARLITAGLDNPYDRAVAVTQFLRDNITYSDTVPIWPSGQEPIDWILFEHQQAFCNYYATAEIVLLRSVGIPARLAVGYAQGERDQATGLYLVRQRDAHAWPEVYFSGIGWVEFEPTLNQQPLERPLGEEIDPAVFDDPQPGSEVATEEDTLFLRDELQDLQDDALAGAAATQNRALIVTALITALGAGLLVLAGLAWRRGRRTNRLAPLPVMLNTGIVRLGLRPPATLQRWAKLASLNPLERAYLELNRALRRLGTPALATDTPAERALRLGRQVPPLEPPGQALVEQYQAMVYSPHLGDERIAQQAGRDIRRLSWLAWLNRLLARWQEPVRTPRRLRR